MLADTLGIATGKFLDNDKSPSRKVGELDNRGSHFYLGLYWAQALIEQSGDVELKAYFQELATNLSEHEEKIVAQLNEAQGDAVDLDGYYFADTDLASAAMRPSELLNEAIVSFTP